MGVKVPAVNIELTKGFMQKVSFLKPLVVSVYGSPVHFIPYGVV